MEKVAINTPFIKLDAFLKFSALTGSGGEAKNVISDGLVSVNGEICFQRGRKLYPGDIISFCGADLMVIKDENS